MQIWSFNINCFEWSLHRGTKPCPTFRRLSLLPSSGTYYLLRHTLCSWYRWFSSSLRFSRKDAFRTCWKITLDPVILPSMLWSTKWSFFSAYFCLISRRSRVLNWLSEWAECNPDLIFRIFQFIICNPFISPRIIWWRSSGILHRAMEAKRRRLLDLLSVSARQRGHLVYISSYLDAVLLKFEWCLPLNLRNGPPG